MCHEQREGLCAWAMKNEGRVKYMKSEAEGGKADHEEYIGNGKKIDLEKLRNDLYGFKCKRVK